MTNNKPVLVVENLTVEYAVKSRSGRKIGVARAVDDISLTIGSGETLAIVGESGSGKSSIANAIMRLVEVAGGSIVLDGQDLTQLNGGELRAARRNFQMIFQDPFESLDPRRTVLDTVMDSVVIAGLGKSADEQRSLSLMALENVGLTPPQRVGERFTYQLSGGQRQRVAIAAAMALKPRLLVADEPVSMLDVSLRAGILRLMQQMSEQLGVATLFITHDLSLAWMYADRIAVVYLGRVIEEAPAADLIRSPSHPYTQALVSVIPVPEVVSREKRIVLTGEIPNSTDIPSGCRFRPRCQKFRELEEPEACLTQDPELKSLGNHHVACHFAG